MLPGDFIRRPWHRHCIKFVEKSLRIESGGLMKRVFLIVLIAVVMTSSPSFAWNWGGAKAGVARTPVQEGEKPLPPCSSICQEAAVTATPNGVGSTGVLNTTIIKDITVDPHASGTPTMNSLCPSGSKLEGSDLSGRIYLTNASGYSECSIYFSAPYDKAPNCFFSSNKIHNHTLETNSWPDRFRIASDDGFGNGAGYEELQYVCFTR